jgi:pyruvate/oxaloacetate carboxyltransferase
MNLLSGKRYSLISKECKSYVLGQYGRPVGPIAEELKKAVFDGSQEMITVRPGSLLAPGWEKAKAESIGFAQSDEDVLTYAMFPEAGMNFLKKKYHL